MTLLKLKNSIKEVVSFKLNVVSIYSFVTTSESRDSTLSTRYCTRSQSGSMLPILLNLSFKLTII